MRAGDSPNRGGISTSEHVWEQVEQDQHDDQEILHSDSVSERRHDLVILVRLVLGFQQLSAVLVVELAIDDLVSRLVCSALAASLECDLQRLVYLLGLVLAALSLRL